MAVSNNFQAKSLNDALQRLVFSNVINDEQRNVLEEYYKNDPRGYDEISRELNKIQGHDERLLKDALKKAAQTKVDIKLEGIEDKKEEKIELSLEHITDFEKDGRKYIKIHYPYPYDEVKIIENMTDPYRAGKELFESLNGTQDIISVDGKTNATSIFEQTLMRDCVEVKIHDAMDFTKQDEIQKLTKEQLQIVVGTLRTLVQGLPIPDEEKEQILEKPIKVILEALNKKIWISPEDNIITVCDSNTHEKDMVDTLKVEEYQTSNGVKTNYKLRPLQSNSYSYESSITEENSMNSGSNTEYEKTQDQQLEAGISYSKKKKKKKKEAAFVSILSLMIIGSVILGIISASLIKLYIK